MKRPVFHCHCGDHAFAALTRGFVTLVSPQDAHLLTDYLWSAKIDRWTTYAQRSARQQASGTVRLHREIVRPLPGHLVDHINRNGLDNRRPNLRTAKHNENSSNRRSTGSLGFLGVYKIPSKWGRPFRAAITIDGVFTHIGCFATPQEAARARDAVARKTFGEFASLNFPDRGQKAAALAEEKRP